MRLLNTDNASPQHKARTTTIEKSPVHATAGTIYFDASCGMCSAGVRRFERIVTARGFVFAPLQDPGVAEMLGLALGEIPNEIKLRTRDGAILGGADALLYVGRKIWWGWPVWAISLLPGMKRVFRWLYARVANNRHRISGACSIRQ